MEQWYYEKEGERLGPITQDGILELFESNQIDADSLIWKKGLNEWVKFENTNLYSEINTMPPPLLKVNNNLIWIVAFAPLWADLLELMVIGVASGFLNLAINLAICYYDEKLLRKAGHNIDKVQSYLIPVYLFKRAKLLKHSNAYAITWIVLFVLSLFL
ncbi:MAG: DUF4339 domain-containing protein [Fusobacteriaceae bacterium]